MSTTDQVEQRLRALENQLEERDERINAFENQLEERDERIHALESQVAAAPRRKAPSQASQVLKAAPRSKYEKAKLVTGNPPRPFSDKEVLACRKYFNGDVSKPITKRPYIRVNDEVHDLLEFLYRFKGANYGCIGQRGIWSNTGKDQGRSYITTKMKLLHAADLVYRDKYHHRKAVDESTEWWHVTPTARAIRLLQEDGTIGTGTNPHTAHDRQRGEEDPAFWSHQNQALEGALHLCANTRTDKGITDTFALDYSAGEVHREQAAYQSVPLRSRSGRSVADVVAGAGKLNFKQWKGRLLAPDITLVKTSTDESGEVRRTLILLEYDHGNYARIGALDTKLDMLRGPFGAIGDRPEPPPDEEVVDYTDENAFVDDSGDHPAYEGNEDTYFFDDATSAERQKPKGEPHESAQEKSDRYWAAKAKEYDDVKLVFVSYDQRVRREEMRRLAASYEPSQESLAKAQYDAQHRAYIEKMKERKDYVNAHCEFVTLAELEKGRTV